jgi:hypothetical protein
MDKYEFSRNALPLLEAAVTELLSQVEAVRIKLESSATNQMILSAFFEVPRTDTDMLFLNILFMTVDGTEMVDATVQWDHDSLYTEAEVPEAGYVPATSENLERLFAELPRLIAAFKTAVLRGLPADEINKRHRIRDELNS